MSHPDAPPRGLTRLGPATLSMALMVGFLWLLEAVDQGTGNALDRYGIHPRSQQGLLEIFSAPFLHSGWAHLMSNTVPFFVLGVLVLLDGWRRWLATSLVVVLASGAFVWLFAPSGSVTLGASGVVFGWLAFLVLRGLYTRAAGQIALGVVIFLVYGGILLGALPGTPGISWQAHLGGAVGGVLAARSQRRSAIDPRWD